MSAAPPARRGAVEIGGVRVNALRLPEVLAAIDDLLSDGSPHQVVTVNAEFVARAREDPAFARVLEESDLATVDGMGVVFALRLLHGVRASRVGGTDMLPDLARLAARRRWPVFLLGAMPGIAETAAERLVELAPGLWISGTYSGSPHPREDARTAEMIRSGGTRLLLVAFGTPAQERWIARNLANLGPCVAIGVGGTFDYLAGVVPRAPLWMQRAGLEWLYRLIRQPWRWRRQLALPLFVYLVAVREPLRSRLGRAGTARGGVYQRRAR
jgi:N-acetylglucosaminyldiphosphoundecaprenol N-acetyl-beta-D-mannosaminyltransferase